MAGQPMTDEVLEQRSSDRKSILRNALIYTPVALVALVLFMISLSALLSGNGGATVPVVILALIGTALVYEAVAALRDLRAEPVVTAGEVDRIWKKSRLLIFGRQDYLLIQKRVFEVGPVAAMELSVGEAVSVQHWPNTLRVITVERVRGDRKS